MAEQTHPDFDLSKKDTILKRRYEALAATNDLLIGIWFLLGSIFFLTPSLVERGTWLFILGSAQLLIKPAIKLAQLIHFKHIYKTRTQS